MCNIRKIVYAVLMIISVSCNVFAADNACLLEGTVMAFGTAKEVKDCIQNTGVTEAALKKTCEHVSNLAVQVGAAPAKITYMDTCPKSAQATCAGFLGQPMASYYYKRTEKLLESSKKSCEMQGGTWN